MTRRSLRAPFARYLSLVLLVACGQASELDTPDLRIARIAGCYTLTVEGGGDPLRTFEGLRAFALLVDSVSPERPNIRRVAPPRGSPADSMWMASFQLRSWTVGEHSDSVLVSFGHGHGGPALALIPRGDSLVGEALLVGDTEPFSSRVGPARAARVACVAP